MKKIAFILGLVALFAVSCNSNNSSTKKGSVLEDLLVEFQTEDPQEAAKHKAITDSDYSGKNELLKVMLDDEDYGVNCVKGPIGHIDSLYEVAWVLKNSIKIIPYGSTYNTFGLDEESNISKLEYYNIETGYVVFSIRKNGVLHCILRGYLHASDDFKGVLYTNETKLPFCFDTRTAN